VCFLNQQYMEARRAKDIISDLRALKAEELSLIEELAALTIDLDGTDIPNGGDRTVSRVSRVTDTIVVGDRERIKNKLAKPASWNNQFRWVASEAKLATVTRITRNQVHFITDNGVETWRAVNNLERISP
jgi:hypothetical protein